MRMQMPLVATVIYHVTILMTQSSLWNKNFNFVTEAAFQSYLPTVTHRKSALLSVERMYSSPTVLKTGSNISAQHKDDDHPFVVLPHRDVDTTSLVSKSRRKMLLQSITSMISMSTVTGYNQPKVAFALEEDTIEKEKVLVVLSGEAKQVGPFKYSYCSVFVFSSSRFDVSKKVYFPLFPFHGFEFIIQIHYYV